MGLLINPATKVGALLEAYPGMEEVLIRIAPAFTKLRNPVLRNTVAKIATLEQAARIGGVGVKELVDRLREAAGQAGPELLVIEEKSQAEPAPCWFSENRLAMTIDVDSMLQTGVHPLARVQQETATMERGAILRLVSGFRPEPLIKMMQDRGLGVWSRQASAGKHITDICRL